MTNDLMRDLIENRIPGHETPTAVWAVITPVVPEWSKPPEPDAYADWFQQIQADINRAYENLLHAAMGAGRTTHFTAMQPQPPTDSRERALWAKQQRGTGPGVGALKERGRVTKYKEKP